MAEDHRAAWLAETSQLRTYKRQRDTVIGTTAATERWKRERLAELDELIGDALWLIDLRLDAWNEGRQEGGRAFLVGEHGPEVPL